MNVYRKLGPLGMALVVLCSVPLIEGCSSTQPAGVQISDAGVTSKVKAKLVADPEINPFNIDVDTEEGVVTLSGRVKNDRQRTEAERLARNTDGVVRVINNLKVGEMTKGEKERMEAAADKDMDEDNDDY